MDELLYVSNDLCQLLRDADHLNKNQLMNRILIIAQESREKYEEQLLEKLVEDQLDPNHPRYDYGL